MLTFLALRRESGDANLLYFLSWGLLVSIFCVHICQEYKSVQSVMVVDITVVVVVDVDFGFVVLHQQFAQLL